MSFWIKKPFSEQISEFSMRRLEEYALEQDEQDSKFKEAEKSGASE